MKTVLKWLGIGVSVLVGLALIGAAAAKAMSSRQINRSYSPGVGHVTVPTDSASIAWGGHIVQAIAKCIDCHGEDLGGTQMIDDGAFGRIAAPNITRGTGGRTASYTDVDWVRAIRHGVKPDGRAVVIMPAESYIHMSDEDLGAVIAWVKSVPPVNRTFPEPTFGPVGRALIAAGMPVFAAARIDHDRGTLRPAPQPDTTVEYGDYLTQVGGCRSCHNQSMSGGPIVGGDPSSPPASNLTPGGIDVWTEADFVRVLREGKKPRTDVAVNEHMPWKNAGRMTDAEIHAMWLYLRSLPSRELGQQ